MKSILAVVFVFLCLVVLNIVRSFNSEEELSWYDEMFPRQAAEQQTAQPIPISDAGAPKPSEVHPEPMPHTESVLRTEPVVRTEPVTQSQNSMSPPQADRPKVVSKPLICKKNGELPRSLVITRHGGRFELLYEKPDGVEAVAWSQSSIKPCQEIREKISQKLEAAGFECELRSASG